MQEQPYLFFKCRGAYSLVKAKSFHNGTITDSSMVLVDREQHLLLGLLISSQSFNYQYVSRAASK